MSRIYLFFCILWMSVSGFAQESGELLRVRDHFQNMDVEHEVKELMNWPADLSEDDRHRLDAYRAVATCMMAEYSWSPIKKLGYFRKGTKLLETSIEQDPHVESVYLRLLIQLKAPEKLNYDMHVEDDLEYLKAKLPGARIEESYKETMVNNVNALLREQDRKELAGNIVY